VRDQAFVFRVELGVVLIDEFHEFVAVDEFEIALGGSEFSRPLVETARRNEEPEILLRHLAGEFGYQSLRGRADGPLYLPAGRLS
jgi:hypothetical protein